LPERDGALELLWAMSLGWRTALTGEVKEPFMRSGTMHLFAMCGPLPILTFSFDKL